VKNILKNFELSVKILTAIWLRKPILFFSKDTSVFNDFFQEIIHFIPDYRQLVIYGNVPNSYIYNKFCSKILTLEDHITLEQSLFQCFEEECINTPPLQIIYFYIDDWIKTNILTQFKKGWIAFTNTGKKDNLKFTEAHGVIFIDVETLTAIFPENYSVHDEIEKKLLSIALQYSTESAHFLLQKKFNEIRYIEKVIVNEIEAGKRVSQVEIEENLEIDADSFLRALELLEAECGLNIKQYIQFKSEFIMATLNQIKRLHGILVATCFNNDQLLGIAKQNNFSVSYQQLFLPFISLIKYLNSLFEWGIDQRLIIELTEGKKILYFRKDKLGEFLDLTFALIIDQNANSILALKEIQTIFKEI